MAQISKGDTFVNGEQVDGTRLNQLVDSAQLLVGAITDQPSITANTLEATDTTIVNDAGVLKEATIGDFLNSNLPITTSSINGVTGADIVVAPAAGQKFDVAGAFEANSNNTVGNSTIGGNLTVTGSSTLTGNVVADNAFTSNGLANFTGQLQVNGTVGYVLYEVFEATVSYSNASVPTGWNAMYASPSLTKPSDEIWIIESDLRWRRTLAQVWAIRLNQTTPNTMLNGTVDIEGGGGDYWHIESGILRYVFNTGTTFTSTITIDVLPVSSAGYSFYCGETNYTTAGTALNSVTFSPSKFRIYKYKTA
jgi:hypothetical protein